MDRATAFPTIQTIDADGAFRPKSTASYLVIEGSEASIIEASTSLATQRILKAIQDAKISLEEVRYVIVTHVHLDHAGGAWSLLWHCPNAICLAHPRAAKHLIDPSRLLSSAKTVYGEEEFARQFGEMKPIPSNRVKIMEDGETLTWGSRVFSFPYARGHANHHFLVHDSRENVLFTGDSFGLIYPNLQMDGLFAYPTTTPIDFNPKEALLTLERIEKMGLKAVAPTHFGLETRVKEASQQLGDFIRFLGGLDPKTSEEELIELQDAQLASWCKKQGRTYSKSFQEWMKPDFELNAKGIITQKKDQ